ncbi:hypothetical protein [Streptomyces sp. NPDC059639]|uniref:ATP-dependent DNA ligase n=1 Tax=Streptomyces sp. NPDC059639 TaxID=3346891 RepID=UPI0036AB40C5
MISLPSPKATAASLRESCPYTERRAALLEVLEPLGPPLQVVPATEDVDVAGIWYEVLPEQGVEGIVAKRAGAPYRPGRSWQKIRNAMNCS